MPKARTWRILSKRWLQIASGLFFVDLSALALVRALYPETDPVLYLFGVLIVLGILAIVGAVIGMIAYSYPPSQDN